MIEKIFSKRNVFIFAGLAIISSMICHIILIITEFRLYYDTTFFRINHNIGKVLDIVFLLLVAVLINSLFKIKRRGWITILISIFVILQLSYFKKYVYVITEKIFGTDELVNIFDLSIVIAQLVVLIYLLKTIKFKSILKNFKSYLFEIMILPNILIMIYYRFNYIFQNIFVLPMLPFPQWVFIGFKAICGIGFIGLALIKYKNQESLKLNKGYIKPVVEIKFCRTCGGEIKAGQKVCLGCGFEPLYSEKYCQNCGCETKIGQKLCIKCGFDLVTEDTFVKSKSFDESDYDMGFALLGFFIPIVGLIMYVIMKDDKPYKAHSLLKGVIWSLWIGLIVFILYIIGFCYF